MKGHLLTAAFLLCAWSVTNGAYAQAVQGKTAGSSSSGNLTKERWEQIAGALGAGSKSLLVSGTVRISRQGPSEPEVIFRLAKNQDKVYYRFGETETFNNAQAYIYIDHASKRVVISQSKSVQVSFLPDPEIVAQMIEEKPGLFKETVKDKNIRISFRGEGYADCKEYAMEFDAMSFVPRNIFKRQDDPRSGSQKESEVSVLVRFQQWSTQQPAASIFDYSSLAAFTSGWKLKGPLQNYHLTVL